MHGKQRSHEDRDFTPEQAKVIGELIGVDWDSAAFDAQTLAKGMDEELEHGTKGGPATNVTNDDPVMTARIALAHLNERPDYYQQLEKMEKEPEE